MVTAARLLIISAMAIAGCTSAKNAAVTTFRVIDTPARFVRDRIDPPEGTTTTTTTTTTGTTGAESDVVTPGQPVAVATPRATATPRAASTTSRTASTSRPVAESRLSASPRPSSAPSTSTNSASKSTQTSRPPDAATTEYPTARPVPGKPGFVYSIDPQGGMVDVTGYKSGDKAKDPYTHQIFVVP